MIIMFLLFLVQFAVACACLALSDSQQHSLYSSGWEAASYPLREQAQEWFGCCGYNDTTQDDIMLPDETGGFGHPTCLHVICTSATCIHISYCRHPVPSRRLPEPSYIDCFAVLVVCFLYSVYRPHFIVCDDCRAYEIPVGSPPFVMPNTGWVNLGRNHF